MPGTEPPASLSPQKYSTLLMKIPALFFTIALLFLLAGGCVSSPSTGSHTPNATPANASPVSGESTTTLVSPTLTIVPSLTAVPSPTPDLESQGQINKIYYYTLDGNQGFIPLEVYTEGGQVITAALVLNASIQQLNTLAATVTLWKNKVQADLSNGDSSDYPSDVQMYNQAYSAYQSYYTTVYTPDYTTWNTLNTVYQNEYLPKEMALEDKYGVGRGMNVGVAT